VEIWIAVGDETGGWDIIDGAFTTDFTGLALALGPIAAWDSALQMPLGDSTALMAFSRPFSSRLPAGVVLPISSKKYHVADVWKYCQRMKVEGDILVDQPHPDPVVELLRKDARWLLEASGLGVMSVGGTGSDAKAAGIGISGDGLRERARVFAGLMSVALPFFPADSKLNILVEGRTESDISDAVKANRFSSASEGRADRIRYLEPYRDFVGRLKEDLARSSERCQPLVAGGRVVKDFFCVSSNELSRFLATQARNVPFLKVNSAGSLAAMNGIADLAAALISKPGEEVCRLTVPTKFAGRHWTGNFRDIRHATRS
jgi:hypothetical protein